MKKVDRIMYFVGYGALLVASFAMGWNYDHFTKK